MNRLAKALGAIAVIGSMGVGAAQAADLSFMSFTYAEEANTATVQALLDGFTAADGLTVEPLGFAWGDMQKNLFLRARLQHPAQHCATLRALAADLCQPGYPGRSQYGLWQG